MNRKQAKIDGLISARKGRGRLVKQSPFPPRISTPNMKIDSSSEEDKLEGIPSITSFDSDSDSDSDLDNALALGPTRIEWPMHKNSLNSLSSQGLEALRARYNFDILDLSILTTKHVGRPVVNKLTQNPTQLMRLMSRQRFSYLSFIPSRYDHYPYLRDVVECLMSRLHLVLFPTNEFTPLKALHSYSKALASVQAALNNHATCQEPELLCAIGLLSLADLLDTSRTKAWSHHIAGAARVMELRGPSRFTTAFEKALFNGYVGPILTESMFDNKPCFLDAQAWQNVFYSTIEDDGYLTERSSIAVSLRMLLAKVPSLLFQVGNTLSNVESLGLSTVDNLSNRANQVREEMFVWYDVFRQATPVDLTQVAIGPERNASKDLYGTYLVAMIIINRLVTALSMGRVFQLEFVTFQLALDLESLKGTASSKDSPEAFLLGMHTRRADSIFQTREEWEKAPTTWVSARNSLISASVFERWRQLSRLPVSDCVQQYADCHVHTSASYW